MFWKTAQSIRPSTVLQCQFRRKSVVVNTTSEDVKIGTGAVASGKSFDVYSDDYQYLQKSKIPTLHFQPSLPRLPIPKLEKTCERYLAAQRPLLTEDAFSRTTKLVNEFKSKDGLELQNELKQLDSRNKHTSYICEPWFDMYLKDRSPLPINYNPGVVFSNSNRPENGSQLHRATNMVISSLRFMKSLRANILAPEVYHLNPAKSDTEFFRNVSRRLPPSLSWYGAYLFKAFPLDMSQYSSLFNSTRIPMLARDRIQKDEEARHLLVIKNGHFFIFDVLDEVGDILPPDVIFSCLKYISEKNLTPKSESIGLFTTENRDVWAKARKHIISLSQKNVETFRKIDSALFAVCLDSESVGTDSSKIMRNFLYGDGANRWFDKSFSLVFSKDGVAAVNFEHSWGDGVAILRYFLDVYKDSNTNPFVSSSTTPSDILADKYVTELDVDLDEAAQNGIKEAKSKYEAVCNSLLISFVEHYGFGKNDCKTAKISPDAFMQLAFQVAYHRVWGDFVPTYESCSTAAFKHGRTETVRPCTDATKEFALELNQRNRPGRAELIELMRKCSKIHGNLTKEAAMGEGFDRHLFGLKHVAQRLERKIPEFYEDEAYQNINRNIISTSTLGADAVLMGGFGPVVPNGLGVGYGISNEFCGSVISSYPEKRDGAGFADSLKETIKDLAEIVTSK